MTGFEPLIVAATAGLTGLVTEIIKGQGNSVITRFLSQDIGKSTQQAIFDASKKYIQNYAERHGMLKVLGMREPVILESVYTEVQFLKEEESKKFASVHELEQNFRATQGRGFYSRSEQKDDGIAVANKHQYLMVLGAPGSGKSTFIRKVGLELLKGKQSSIKYQAVPVILELKRLPEGKINLKEIISTEFETCGFPNAKSFTEKALEQGKLLILLDGLDEVPTANLSQVIEAVQDFVDQYDRNHYIASCRLAAYRSNFRRFTDVIMAEFDNERIKQFINNWFQSEEDKKIGTAEKCWKILEKPENIAAKELAHTPLLLTFLCLVYDRSQTLPSNRSTLYRKALRILMEEWAAEKRILREEIYQGLNTELEEVLLSEIAYRGFEADQLFLPQAEIVSQIKAFLSSNLNAPLHLSGESVLSAIAVQQGILVERAEDIYSFSHLTLQEYLTAKYIDDHRQTSSLVEKYLTNTRWREVFLLVSGLMVVGNGADELLLAINQSIHQYSNDPKISKLMLWINQVSIELTSNIKESVKRSLMIMLVLFIEEQRSNGIDAITNRTIDVENAKSYYSILNNSESYQIGIIGNEYHAIAFTFSNERILTVVPINLLFSESTDPASSITTMASDGVVIVGCRERYFLISRGRDIKIIHSNNYDYDLEISHDEKFSISWIKASNPEAIEIVEFDRGKKFNLDAQMLDFSIDETEKLRQYLYATDLLIQCKQAAVRVSHHVWESIEDKILLPPS